MEHRRVRAAADGVLAVFNVTWKQLASWGGAPLLREAEQAVKRGDVLQAAFKAPWAEGSIRYAGRELKTRFRVLSGGLIDSHCPCVANQRDGRVCIHVVAVGVLLHQRAASPAREAQRSAERQHAAAIAQAEAAGAFIQRASARQGGVAAELRVRLPEDWVEQFWAGRVTAACTAQIAGEGVPLDRVSRQGGLALSAADEAILFVLEDICEGAPKGAVELTKSDLLGLIDVHRAQGRRLFRRGGDPLTIRAERVAAQVVLDLDRDSGELLLRSEILQPDGRPLASGGAVVAYGRAGWVFAQGALWPLDRPLPGPYQQVYRGEIRVPRADVVRFLRRELDRLRGDTRLSTGIDLDLLEIEPAEPVFSLRVKGSPASVALSLHARYEGGHEVPAAAAHALGDFAVPDPAQALRYQVRNNAAEEAAVARLNRLGIGGRNGAALQTLVGERPVLNLLGSQLPALRRSGWQVGLEGRLAAFAETLDMAIPVVRIRDVAGPRRDAEWFDVDLRVLAPDGATIAPADVQRALMRGESFLQQGDQTLLLDAESIRAMRGVFEDCASREGAAPGSFRLDAVYAPYVQSSLDALDGIDLEEPPDWRRQVEARNRQQALEPVPLGEPLQGTLRPYQHDGVAWLRFLEANGVCGILADEMGLGKTLQTLSWLQLPRVDEALRELPVLIVCPTSLVENWQHEARRFTPGLSTLALSGAQRHERWKEVPAHALVITSYALLRRDIERFAQQPFACVVLDEAQHIKNRSTQNAIAAKRLRARHRLVLTGTPVENSVADLWSIMDFLMPGYLGAYDAFRLRYEVPLATPGEPEAEEAQRRLRRKLHPFMLRRRKREVARDLPDKLTKISYCALSPDQRVAYDTLLNATRQRLGGLVAESGFDRSRIEILAALMKLRQVCCHLALLKDEGLAARAAAPSAKLEQFFELLDEALDGGHRMLVFSQFVGMLTLLRKALEERGIAYSYLDGSTRDRLDVCRNFNRDESVPVFLISLKAGGTGLNLTGADMVVHFDPWWNPAVEDQATDRAHRIGQHRTVYSIKLIAEDTVEEKVLELQRRKQAVIGAMVEGDAQVLSKLSWDDVRDLLSMD